MTENHQNCISISLFECNIHIIEFQFDSLVKLIDEIFDTFFLYQYRLKTGVCSMAMPRVVIVVPWEFSNPLQNSEAQKISNFQESWNSLIQDFLYVHSNR